jgi:hypothetical protein
MSRYDAVDSYTYPGTEVLRNKADIRDQAALDAFEAKPPACSEWFCCGDAPFGAPNLLGARQSKGG